MRDVRLLGRAGTAHDWASPAKTSNPSAGVPAPWQGTNNAAADWLRGLANRSAASCVKNPLKQVCESDIDVSKEANPKDPSTLHPAFVDALRNYASKEPLVGSAAPDFRLQNLDGETVQLSELLKSKPVVLITGSVTCSIFRRQAMMRVEQLRRDFGQNVHVVMLYVEEAHPALGPSPLARGQWTHFENLSDGILIRRPENADQRRGIAALMAERFGLSTANIVVDTMDNKNWENYLHIPNAAYVIGKDGKVAYREPWAFRDVGASPRPKLFDVVEAIGRPTP